MRITDNLELLKEFLEELEREKKWIIGYNETLFKQNMGYPRLYMWDYHYEDNPYTIMGIIRRELRVRKIREELMRWAYITMDEAGWSRSGYHFHAAYLYRKNGVVFKHKDGKFEKCTVDFNSGMNMEEGMNNLPMNKGDRYLFTITNRMNGNVIKRTYAID